MAVHVFYYTTIKILIASTFMSYQEIFISKEQELSLICFFYEAHLLGAQLSVGSIVDGLIRRGLICRGSTVGAQLSEAQMSVYP